MLALLLKSHAWHSVTDLFKKRKQSANQRYRKVMLTLFFRLFGASDDHFSVKARRSTPSGRWKETSHKRQNGQKPQILQDNVLCRFHETRTPETPSTLTSCPIHPDLTPTDYTLSFPEESATRLQLWKSWLFGEWSQSFSSTPSQWLSYRYRNLGGRNASKSVETADKVYIYSDSLW